VLDVSALYASCVMGLGRDTGRFDTGGMGTDVDGGRHRPWGKNRWEFA